MSTMPVELNSNPLSALAAGPAGKNKLHAPGSGKLTVVLSALLFLVTLPGLAAALPGTEEPGGAEKKDVIYLVNGDRVSGEITKLENGVLHLKSELAGSIQVNWENVERLAGVTPLLFTLLDETQYRGSLSKEPAEDETLTVDTGDDRVRLHLTGLALAETVNKPPVDRFKGDVSFGLTLLKARETRQFSLGLKGSYTADSYYTEASYNALYSTDNASGRNDRDYLNALYQRPLPRDWFFTGMFNTTRNDALELDLRYNFNAALGKDIISNDTATLQVLAGLGFVSEQYEGGEDYSDLETVFGLKLKAFELDSPKLSMTAETFIYPRPGDFDRFRIESRTGLNLMLARNIFLGLSFFDSYNSKPPSPGAVKNDYGLVSSLGVNW